MLNIKTIKNVLVTDETKDGFCFRSTCSQSLSQKKLAKGYSVELPFGTLRANATGTCANIQDGFTLGNGNHTLGFLFNANEETISSVKAKLEYKQLPPDITGEAKLYRITSLNDDASESSNLSFTAGKTLRLHGRNLTFDITDENQGVFLENENGIIRIAVYNRRGTNVVDTPVPGELAAGSYNVSIVTKPGNTYFTANIDSVVTVA